MSFLDFSSFLWKREFCSSWHAIFANRKNFERNVENYRQSGNNLFRKKKIAKNVLYVKWTNVLFLQGEKKIENKKFFNTQQLATVQLIFVRKNCIINDCTRFADGKFESERAKKNLSSTFRELRRGKKRSGNARRDPFKNRELLN